MQRYSLKPIVNKGIPYTPLLPVVGSLPSIQSNLNNRKDNFTKESYCIQFPNSYYCVGIRSKRQTIFDPFNIVNYKIDVQEDNINLYVKLIQSNFSLFKKPKYLLIIRKE